MPRSYRSGMRRTSITAIAIIVLSVIWASPQLDAAPPPAATFHGLIPARLLDTRPGATTIDGQSQGTGPVATGSITNVTVSGRAGVPTDAGAVALTVTAVNPTAASFVTVWPAGSTRPTASNLKPATQNHHPEHGHCPVGYRRPLQIGGGFGFRRLLRHLSAELCQRPSRRSHRFQHHDAKSMVWRAAHPEMPSPDL